MSNLGELLGTLMVSLAKARQIADAETAAMAEWYKAHPLLEGVGVPRVRVPELVIEVPLLLQSEERGEPNKIAEPHVIANAARAELVTSAQRAGSELTTDIVNKAVAEITTGVSDLQTQAAMGGRSISREAVARLAENAVAHALSGAPSLKLGGDAVRSIVGDVRRRVQDSAEITPGRAPRINATLMTSEVKEKADPSTVTRIRMTLREEGLEWSSAQTSNGTSVQRLLPE